MDLDRRIIRIGREVLTLCRYETGFLVELIVQLGSILGIIPLVADAEIRGCFAEQAGLGELALERVNLSVDVVDATDILLLENETVAERSPFFCQDQ